MQTALKRLVSFLDSPAAVPLLLLAVALLAYGLLIPQLGFYWDDLPMSWIRYQFGPLAMARYFSTNRPVWGLLYQLTTRLLPHVPVYWQVFALFWRWAGAVLSWAIFRDLWPARPRFALTAGLFFLLYPGFDQQWVSYLYSHFFIVLSFFLFSILCMLWSFHPPKWLPKAWPLTLAGMSFSALNLWMMEYFFVLELFRPFLIFFALRGQTLALRPRLGRTFRLWLPYLAVFLADVYWRLFVFNNQIYTTALIPKLKAEPLAASLVLAKTILSNLWLVSVTAWGGVFHFPNPAVDGPRTALFYAAVVLAALSLIAFFLFRARQENAPRREAFWAIGLGLVAMLAAGWPFWLVDLPIKLAFPADRFTLPFMLGVGLLLAGLLELIPLRVRLVLAAALAALAAGRQALWEDDFRRDWATQKAMFWQMIWRAPGLKPDTIVLMNEGALNFYADNSLGAALNWIYDPGSHSAPIHYVFFYPTSRLGGSLPGFEPGIPVNYDYLVGTFTGSTSQAVAFYYQPPGCLRLLDPEIDAENYLIRDESLMREAARLSAVEQITASETARMPAVYGSEPRHGWCYYFERADLARQLNDWQRVVELGDVAFKLDDYPNDPLERFVFIEGYAHAGQWARAQELSIQSYKVSPNYVGPLLCRLWERIEASTPESAEKQAAVEKMRGQVNCYP